MPFFALVMVESHQARMFDALKAEIGEETLADMSIRFFVLSKIV